jgi:hypothetical protein
MRFLWLFLIAVASLNAATLTNVQFNITAAASAGSATLTSTAFDIGNINSIFDNDVNSLARTPNINPAFVQVAYTQPHTFRGFRVYLSYGSSYTWSIAAADSTTDMDSKTGSYRVIVPSQSMPQSTWKEYTLPTPQTANVLRLTLQRFGGDNYCHINEWQIFGDAEIDALTITPPGPINLYPGDKRQFRAEGKNSALKETYALGNLASWSTPGPLGTIDTNGLFRAIAQGSTTVTATYAGLTSPAVNFTVLPGNTEFDLDVLYIERTPRIAFNPSDTTYNSGRPAPGQPMTYLAHVKNWGTNETTARFEWFFDDQLSSTGDVTIPAGQELTIPYAWTWQAADHELEFRIAPNPAQRELATLNNRRRIRTNALLMGLWIEESLYSYMHQNQYRLNDGANSFEDWGQRMVARWNDMFARAVYPWATNGMLDRLALDKVVVVPDDALPLKGGLSGNNPDTDNTVDVMWGYPWNPDNILTGNFYGFRWNGPFLIDYGSIHEMNHARYHVDLYALDENHNANAQHVLLTDDNGALIPGTTYMPFIAFDVVCYNKWRDVMGAGPGSFFDGYSAGAWNWKHHKRGRGNQNAPPDLGAFLNDLPATNIFQFVDQNGIPLAGAEIALYRGAGSFYSKTFDDIAEQTFTADDAGKIILGRNPFGATATFGGSVPDIVFKVRYNNQLYFFFQEVTDFNIQHWLGNKTTASYFREIDLRDKTISVPTGAWLGNYFNGPIHSAFVTNRTDATINFQWPNVSDPPVNADNFSVYWEGRFQFTEGWKQFRIRSDGRIRFYIDGRLLLDQWQNQTLNEWKPILYTSANSPFVNPGRSTQNGNYHRLEVRYEHASGPAEVLVSWAEAPAPNEVPQNAWRADYFTTRSLTGYLFSRLEERIDNNYAGGSPEPSVPSDGFSARWTGDWDFAAGVYAFNYTADDGIRIWIDNVKILDRWTGGLKTGSISQTLTAGPHRIVVEYYDETSTARAHFTWARQADKEALFENPHLSIENFAFDLIASPDHVLRIEASPDFRAWSTVTRITNTATASAIEVGPLTNNYQFYRTVVER